MSNNLKIFNFSPLSRGVSRFIGAGCVIYYIINQSIPECVILSKDSTKSKTVLESHSFHSLRFKLKIWINIPFCVAFLASISRFYFISAYQSYQC